MRFFFILNITSEIYWNYCAKVFVMPYRFARSRLAWQVLCTSQVQEATDSPYGSQACVHLADQEKTQGEETCQQDKTDPNTLFAGWFPDISWFSRQTGGLSSFLFQPPRLQVPGGSIQDVRAAEDDVRAECPQLHRPHHQHLPAASPPLRMARKGFMKWNACVDHSDSPARINLVVKVFLYFLIILSPTHNHASLEMSDEPEGLPVRDEVASIVTMLQCYMLH